MPRKERKKERQVVNYTANEPVLKSRPDGSSGGPPGYGGPGGAPPGYGGTRGLPPGYAGHGRPPPVFRGYRWPPRPFGVPHGPPPGYGGHGGHPLGFRGPSHVYGVPRPVFRGLPPGFRGPGRPPPGYGVLSGIPPGYGGPGAPPGFRPPGPRSQAYMGVGASGGPDPRALLPSGHGQDEIQYVSSLVINCFR